MSVLTQLQIRSLVRDTSGHLAAQGAMLRRAENVVLRAPGVAESRPNFTPLYETSSSYRIKSLREFQGSPIAVDQDTVGIFEWRLRNLISGTQFTNIGFVSTPEPLDFDQSETRFAEARGNLYITAKRGTLKISDVNDTASGLDFAGVDMLVSSDIVTANAAQFVPFVPVDENPAFSWTYAYVFAREDANGYVRRSPPSDRFTVRSYTRNLERAPGKVRWTDSLFLREGDKIETYRTRRTDGSSPPAELYLVSVHTLTAGDIANGYITATYDTVGDDQLGATLYTSPSQLGVIGTKYSPPIAGQIATFGSCTWYGNTIGKQRTQPLRIRSMGFKGTWRQDYQSNYGLFTLASPVVTVVDTSLVTKGDLYTDNQENPALAGTYVPANTTIASVDSPTQITMSANALLGSGLFVAAGVPTRNAPRGIIGPQRAGDGTYTVSSAVVTGLTDTSKVVVGMYWTQAAGYPSIAGSHVPADTKVDAVLSGTSVRMTKVALASGANIASSFGDIVTVNGVDFYAMGDALTQTAIDAYPAPRLIFYADDTSTSAGMRSTARYGDASPQSFMSQLVLSVNYYASQTPSFKVRAVALGDLNLDYQTVGSWCGSVLFEEIGLGGASFTVSTTCPSAFDLDDGTLVSDNDAKPNRIYWSALDEPEAVPLVNFVDVGSQANPIMALVPLRNALLVFKADGVWRVTGSGPSAWALECIEPGLRLLRPEAVTVVDNTAYCWAERGIFAVTEQGATSISAGCLDVELGQRAGVVIRHPATHGTFALAWPERQLVLFGVPAQDDALECERVYCFSLITQAWSEWMLPVGAVASAPSAAGMYHARKVEDFVTYEARESKDSIDGYDRTYDLTLVDYIDNTTLVEMPTGAIGRWIPRVGDTISALIVNVRYHRRILSIGGSDTLQFIVERAYPTNASPPSDWQAHEMASCILVLEWHPTGPAGLPVGALCREFQVQMDLREAAFLGSESSIPSYYLGGTPESSTTETLLQSQREPRVNQIQPIRIGCPRAIARSAYVAAMLKTSDIFALRVNGLSQVFEGASERTRR